MSGQWADSNRAQELPSNWRRKIRPAVLQRDRGRCQWREKPYGPVCGVLGKEVDHINDPHNHSLDNLQVLCRNHHKIKTAQEAARARTPLHRPPEQHPSLG